MLEEVPFEVQPLTPLPDVRAARQSWMLRQGIVRAQGRVEGNNRGPCRSALGGAADRECSIGVSRTDGSRLQADRDAAYPREG